MVCVWKVPSAPPKNQLLGILYVEVDLTIFEEPVGFEGVCVGIQRFVVKYRPFRYSIGYQKSISVDGLRTMGYRRP